MFALTMSMVFGRIPYKVFYLWRGTFVFPSHSYKFRSVFKVEKNKKNEKTTNKRMKKHFLTCSFGMETIFSRIFFISPRSIIISHKQQYREGKKQTIITIIEQNVFHKVTKREYLRAFDNILSCVISKDDLPMFKLRLLLRTI